MLRLVVEAWQRPLLHAYYSANTKPTPSRLTAAAEAARAGLCRGGRLRQSASGARRCHMKATLT